MIKKELLALRTLKATPKMMEMARNDRIESRKWTSIWGGTYTYKTYEYNLFMRCQTLKGYLKVAFFLPSHMRCGSDRPVYDLYIHKKAGQYLTYDHRNQKWLTAMADNLDWHMDLWKGKIWINPEGNQTIKNYLGVSKTGFDGIVQYQRKVKEENLEARYKRQTDKWDADLNLTPKLPKDWENWINKVAVPDHYILYDYVRSGAKQGHCTYCDKDVAIEKPAHNKKGKCPCCGREITYKAKGKQRYIQSNTYFAYLLQRTKTGFVVREFSVKKTFRQDLGWNARIWDYEFRRAFFDQNARQLSAYRWEMFRNRETRFCADENCGYYWHGHHQGYVYNRTLPSLAKEELKLTAFTEYLKQHPKMDAEWYLALWNRYPQIEMFVKANLPKLVEDGISNRTALDEVYNGNISGGLAKRMHLDDQRLKRLRDNGGGYRFWQWLRYEKKNGKLFPDAMIQWFTDNQIAPSGISFIRDRMSDVQIYNYLRRQMEESNLKAQESLTTWKDTLNMAQRYSQNLNDPYVYRPSRLKQRHDEYVLRGMMEDLKQAAEKTRKEFPKVEEILREIKDIYSFTGEQYMVVVPDTILEIMVEGKSLNHCVVKSSRYMERIERRESYIMFLRKTAAPDQAYYTLEVEPDGTVRQKRSRNDEQYPDIADATKFLKQWQKAITKKLTEKERALAKKSKELRLEGFDQMRRDHLTIRTGSLQGRLLVDVLMADLIENEEEKTA